MIFQPPRDRGLFFYKYLNEIMKHRSKLYQLIEQTSDPKERMNARLRKRRQRDRERVQEQSNPLSMILVVKNKMNGEILIIDKESYTPKYHEIIIAPDKLNQAVLNDIVADPKFVQTETSKRLLGDVKGEQPSTTETATGAGGAGGQGEELLHHLAGASLFEGLDSLRGEGRGAEQIHPAPAPDRGGGGDRGPRPRSSAHARPRLEHPGQWQDFHHDQGVGDALPRTRGGQADSSTDDRPQRAGRPDAQEPRRARPGQPGARQQHHPA